MAVETLRVAERIELVAPDGSTVALVGVGARLERAGERLVDVWLVGDLDPADWARVDAGRWFHLEPEVRGPSFGGDFDPGAPVRIEARLAPEHATALALVAESEWHVLAEIRGAKLLPRLRDTESWYALYVTQRRGPVRGGFRTTWADVAA